MTAPINRGRRSARIKVTAAPAITTRAEAEDALCQLRGCAISRAQASADRERELAAVENNYRDALANLDAEIKRLSEDLAAWADANRAEFGKSKSLEMTHGVLGWRTGMPKLVKVVRDSWDDLVVRVDAILGSGYVRIKEEVHRDAIIAARGSLDPEHLKSCGLRIEQAEAFYVEPKLDQPETRQTVAA